MTPYPAPPQPSEGVPPGKPGRKPGPIADGVGVAHRAWLEPLRAKFTASGLTVTELSERSGWAKSKVSELLRGTGLYPRWEITYSLLRVLGIPAWPVRRLWMAAAREAHKKDDWIDGCLQKAALTTGPSDPPLDHRAFEELNRPAYLAYAQAFLTSDDEAHEVVTETFDILWLRWQEALNSPDVMRFAWNVLRHGVMTRARHLDGCPDLTTAAFNTVVLSEMACREARFIQVEESMALFQAMGRLPAQQLDVMILKHLRGMDFTAVADVLGIPLASVRFADRYAQQHLTSVLCPKNAPGGTTA
ncbi:RNA polymerase subunit sigma [Streptomyces sp. CB02923]|uniref:RNA polymerase subunit sigma n=1 Tax=Streptomyces sp. CB02923 TaxID=1718985 RepID=UPI00093BC525|nr:RNA polymerase subunit sigma [Streptomyces sp. CB02923]OKI06228.1 RNA polymerase subunit sigma [Streptomyces sp. CB02923]